MANLIAWIVAHYQDVITSVSAVCTALVALFMLIPGDQPEKFLQGVVDFLSKFSRK